MKLLDRFHKIFAYKSISNIDFVMSVDEQIATIQGYPNPKDSVEQSYVKYLCRKRYFTFYKQFIYDLIGLLFNSVAILLSLFPYDSTLSDNPCGILFEKHTEVPYDSIIPDYILNRKDLIIVENCSKKFGFLIREAKRYYFECVRRYPGEFFFHYFVYKELVAHSFFLKTYDPQSVIVYVNERNVASPILKELYENRGREISMLMHGERIIELFEAFISFSKLYVWDEWYINFYKFDLRADIGEYIVYTPPKYERLTVSNNRDTSYSFTFYYGDESIDALVLISKLFRNLTKNGYRCKVRPHPRDDCIKKSINRIFHGLTIEDPRYIPLVESLDNTQYAIGLKTTVMFEALYKGIPVILDDWSSPEKYNSLRKKKYRLFSEKYFSKCELLSNYIQDNKIFNRIEGKELE